MADLDQGDYGIKLIETRLSAAEQFVVDLLGVLIQSGVDLSSWAGKPTAFEQLAREIGEKTGSILRFNDPKGIYSHCLCDVIQ